MLELRDDCPIPYLLTDKAEEHLVKWRFKTPAECGYNCLCKTCAKDTGGECLAGDCERAAALHKCPVKRCVSYEKRR